MDPGQPVLDRNTEAFDDEDRATSEDLPESIEDIERIKDERQQSAMSDQIKNDQAKGLTPKGKGKK